MKFGVIHANAHAYMNICIHICINASDTIYICAYVSLQFNSAELWAKNPHRPFFNTPILWSRKNVELPHSTMTLVTVFHGDGIVMGGVVVVGRMESIL
jgi:hypothetical protein